MRTCIIIDDEMHSIRVLRDLIVQCKDLTLIGEYSNPVKALNDLTSGRIRPDLTFLDISMPDISGIELGKLVRHLTTLVFITAYAELTTQALEIFDYEAAGYLSKPISLERFTILMDRINTRNISTVSSILKSESFFIEEKKTGHFKRLHYEQVVYIESAAHYLNIKDDISIHITRMNISEIEECLPSEIFARVHKGYIVNKHKVDKILDNEIIMNEKSKVYMSGTYKKAFIESMSGLFLKRPKK